MSKQKLVKACLACDGLLEETGSNECDSRKTAISQDDCTTSSSALFACEQRVPYSKVRLRCRLG